MRTQVSTSLTGLTDHPIGESMSPVQAENFWRNWWQSQSDSKLIDPPLDNIGRLDSRRSRVGRNSDPVLAASNYAAGGAATLKLAETCPCGHRCASTVSCSAFDRLARKMYCATVLPHTGHTQGLDNAACSSLATAHNSAALAQRSRERLRTSLTDCD